MAKAYAYESEKSYAAAFGKVGKSIAVFFSEFQAHTVSFRGG